MLKRVLLGLIAVIVALVGFIQTRESTYMVSRTITIKAPAAVVFEFVNDLREWVEWSPWDKLDPAAKRVFEGPKAGVGAIYGWKGNDQVGAGKMTIIQSRPPNEVSYRLEFLEPWTSTCNSGFSIEPEGDGVFVTWSMLGENGFVAKAMSVFVNVDEMVGPDFERGLLTLKSTAELRAAKRAEAVAAEAVVAETADPAPVTDEGD